MWHDLVYTAQKIRDFYAPGYWNSFIGHRDHLYAMNGHDGLSFTHLWPYEEHEASSRFYGVPMFDIMPRLSIDRRYALSHEVIISFQTFIKDNGGVRFFQSKNCNSLLRRHYDKIKSDTAGRWIEGKAFQDELINDLASAKRAIEEQLPGKAVEHLCVPWFKISRSGLQAAQSSKYKLIFIGESGFSAQADDRQRDVISVPRLSDDYIYRLPGDERKTIISLFVRKLRVH